MGRACYALLLALVGVAILPGAVARAQLAAPLSQADRARLERGEIVRRPQMQQRGAFSLIGGASFQVIDLPEDAIWRALSDPASYRHMLPQVQSSREVAREASTRTVRIHHHRGPVDVDYCVRMTFQRRDHLVLFSLDDSRPHDIRAGWGYVRVRPWSEGRTLVSFGVLVDVGTGIVTGLMRSTFQEWLLKIPLTMKWYVEGRGRSRYASSAAAHSG